MCYSNNKKAVKVTEMCTCLCTETTLAFVVVYDIFVNTVEKEGKMYSITGMLRPEQLYAGNVAKGKVSKDWKSRKRQTVLTKMFDPNYHEHIITI